VYAGAGQCDILKGRYIGYIQVNVNYNTRDVKLRMYITNGVSLSEYHFYIGNTPVPVVDGKATVAPGQYPYPKQTSDQLVSGTTGYFERTFYGAAPASGDIFFIFHAVTNGCGGCRSR
jgi:hypothetical protein